MSRTFIASILALSLAVTSFAAAPAAAGNDENLKKFLLGAGTLLIIGSALENSKDKPAHGYGHKKYKKKRHISKVLPRYCLTKVRAHHGPERLFGARCLHRNYRYADWLPRKCMARVKFWRHGHAHVRKVYRARCLRHYGYRLARGGHDY